LYQYVVYRIVSNKISGRNVIINERLNSMCAGSFNNTL